VRHDHERGCGRESQVRDNCLEPTGIGKVARVKWSIQVRYQSVVNGLVSDTGWAASGLQDSIIVNPNSGAMSKGR
jgi:hypothetical protein